MESPVESVQYNGHWKDEDVPADEIDVTFKYDDIEHAIHVTGLGEQGGLVEIEVSAVGSRTVTLAELHEALSRLVARG